MSDPCPPGQGHENESALWFLHGGSGLIGLCGLRVARRRVRWARMVSFLTTALGRLRLIGFLEGASFLLLLGVAMPLKYFAGQPEAVRIAGMAHGVLFLLYLAAAFLAASEYGWKLRITAALVLASFLPFGPFIADARLLRRMSA